MAVGIAVGAWKTKGFRGNLVDFELASGGITINSPFAERRS